MMKKCLKKAMTAIGIVKAVIGRCLFAAHGFVCIWRVVVMKGDPLYWCLTGSLPLLILEGVFTLKKKKGREWKWVCPSVLLYLATAVPAIWFLELNLLDRRILAARTGGRASVNASRTEKITVWNSQISLPVLFAPDDWCKILEQMMLLVLIIGRWLLPKGEITREQLSQLLLVYIGMAADIIELFEAFKEKEVRYNKILTMIILSMWTASLLQFTFVLTATKSKRMRPVLFHSGSSASTISVGGKSCCPTEVLSMMISVMLQDGPFLVMRMLLIFRYGVLSYTNLFFTCKNTLVLVLQFYRLLVLFCQKTDKSTLVIAKDGLNSTGSIDSKAKMGSLKTTGTPKQCKKMSLDVTLERPEGLAERRRSSLMRQDSVTDSSHTQDTDVMDTGIEEGHDINDGDIEDEAADLSSATVPDEEPSNDKGKSKKKEKKKKKKKEDKMGKGKSKLSVDDKDHWADVRKMAKALAFLNETGKCRTVVVNSGGNEHTLLIVDEAGAKELVGKGH
ncbi:transmembrane protein 26-like [Haliotis rufescens]|uniref:transmembrane protein 26-like n=1 Tax=Haliotis rufescens TaxID=6454 RepID=UPI00201E7BD1|nr:transmembrane protein 26-like [Haliotis rufescens]